AGRGQLESARSGTARRAGVRLTAPRGSVSAVGIVYAIANQKGGVGKTTTAVNLAACVAEAGYDTLLVDIDPQCNATIALGLGKDAEKTLYDVLISDVSMSEIVADTSIEGLQIAPAGPDLAGAT